MAFRTQKILMAAVGGLLTTLLIGSISVSASDADQTEDILNRFVVTDDGNRVLTGSVSSSQITQSGWYVSNNDILYYYYENGNCAQNETTLSDGFTYLFASDGALKTGWQTVQGKRFYYNAEIGKPIFGWFNYHDSLYYIDETAGKLTGVQQVNGVPYTFDEYGCVQTGLISYEDGSLYNYATDATLITGWVTEQDGTYYFTDNKGALSGIQYIDDSLYYFSEEKRLVTGGWTQTPAGTVYAGADGKLAVGLTNIDGKSYFFNGNGILQTGLFTADSTVYYSDANGVLQSGIQTINGVSYYFRTDTYARDTGWQTIDNSKYYFSTATGAMQTGWLCAEEGTYYLAKTGAVSGFQVIDNVTYYFDPSSNLMLTDFQTIEGELYFFQYATGQMFTGWFDNKGEKLYFGENGMAAEGLTTIDGDTYYFDPSTHVMQTGQITISGTSYTFDSETGKLKEEIRASIQLDVPDYKQFDERWSDQKINYSTIGKVGCLTSALAMKYSYETGTQTTPDKMVSKLQYSGDNLLWSSCVKLGYTVEDASGSLSQATLQGIYNHLSKGTPVILGAKTSSGGQHYVIVTGYAGSTSKEFSLDDFIINDPGSSKRSKLSEFIALYPNMYKIIY